MNVGTAFDELHRSIRDIHKFLLVLDMCARSDRTRAAIERCRNQVAILEKEFIHEIRKSFEE